jgi:hypothetical protein
LLPFPAWGTENASLSLFPPLSPLLINFTAAFTKKEKKMEEHRLGIR